jgi:hypothetical protein
MGFKILTGNTHRIIETCLHGHYFALDNGLWIHFAKGHAKQIKNSNLCPSGDTLKPEPEKLNEDCQHNQTQDDHDRKNSDRDQYARVCSKQQGDSG